MLRPYTTDCGTSASPQLRFEIELQGDRVVVLRVAGAEQQGHGILAGGLEQDRPRFGPGVELGPVALLELRPARRVVMEPLAQRGRGGHLRQPAVEPQRFFLYAPRPESLHLEALAVGRTRRLVHAFETNHLVNVDGETSRR